jgi:uncharacterized protein (DUF2236 family)
LDDAGYFPRGSMLREVMGERCVGLLYGQRALCIGALKPLNFVGTYVHSHHVDTPFKRLAHTGEMFERIYFGSRVEADQTLAAVAGMHRRVNGELPEDAGPAYPAGTPYDAFDPELMWWTVAVMVDSAAWFFERLVRPFAGDEAEQFYGDWVRFAELFGMPAGHAPATYADFRAWYAEQLAGPDLFLTDDAREVGYMTAFEIPLPLRRRPGKVLHDALMLYSLPASVRAHYGLELTSPVVAAARAILALHPRIRRALPERLARGSCVHEFNLVAATEARRSALARAA